MQLCKKKGESKTIFAGIKHVIKMMEWIWLKQNSSLCRIKLLVWAWLDKCQGLGHDQRCERQNRNVNNAALSPSASTATFVTAFRKQTVNGIRFQMVKECWATWKDRIPTVLQRAAFPAVRRPRWRERAGRAGWWWTSWSWAERPPGCAGSSSTYRGETNGESNGRRAFAGRLITAGVRIMQTKQVVS